jgi:cytochrome c-type biogenesis protein CcmH
LISFRLLRLPAVVLAGLLAASPAGAFTLEEFTFEDPARAAEFRELIEELRCLVCQNENLAASQAELAQDLRMEVYRMLQEGQSRDEVVDFLVARYGDFVLYAPPLKPSTYPLWFGPLILAGIGAIFLGRALLRKKSTPETELSDEERRRLDTLLAAAPGDDKPAGKDRA